MKRLRSWLSDLVLRTPLVHRIVERADSAIREARTMSHEAEKALALAGEELRYQRMRLSERMNDMMDLRIAEIACRNPERADAFAESWSAARNNPVALKETMWELELALEDRGWQRENALAQLEFSRYGIGQLIRIIRIYALKNPLIKRGAEICALYVFGRGVEIRCEDPTPDKVIQEFLKRNECELGHIGLAQKETSIQTDGALCFGLKTSPGQVDVQMIDPLEIMDVVTDPDDSSRDWYYFRQWTRAEFTAEGGQQYVSQECWYPALGVVMDPPDGFVSAQKIKGKPVNWEMPIFRVKVGSPAKWRWPVPPLYASIDWARAYKDFLEDWATVQRTLARFALMVETKGGPAAIAAYEALLSSTFADANGAQIERNPPPSVASAHVSGPDNKISAFKSAGAQVAPEQARRLLLMVTAAHGMPETFYGDSTSGSLATALSLDRPTELKFKEIQQRWQSTLIPILQYRLWIEERMPGSKMREARKSGTALPQVSVVFPAVLEHEVTSMIEAWSHVATLGGRSGIACGIVDRKTIAKGLLQEVGYQDVDKLLDLSYGKNYDPAADLIEQRTNVAAQSIVGTDRDTTNAPETKGAAKAKPKGSIAEAVAHLRHVIGSNGN